MFAMTDGLASRTSDMALLVGRILLGWVFFISGWAKLTNMASIVGYLTSLNVPNPGFWGWPSMIAELVIGTCLILGVATRYISLASIVYIIIATAIAHRYWEYQMPRQMAEYVNFLKNLGLIGASLFLFVTGAGRISLDHWLRNSR